MMKSNFMEILLLLIRLFLAAIFAVAGVAKLFDLEGSEKAVKDFGVPDDVSKTFAVILPTAEILIAFLLLPVYTAWLGAVGAFLLLLIFIGGMLWQMAQGNAPDCHCFGQLHSEPVSKSTLIRNGIFAFLALVLVAQGRASQGLGIFEFPYEQNFMQILIGLATIGLLGAVVFYLKKISEQQLQIMRRIEVLELTAGEGGEVKRDDVHSPHEGLPIGAPAPDFELPDLNGRIVEFEHFLMQGKPMLLFFVSPNCNPCQALLPEIEAWQNELKDQVNFIFISSGKAKENAEKFGGATFKQVLLQENKEVAELFSAQWTPTVILINSDGLIASQPVAGDTAIRDLVEKIRAEDSAKDYFFVANGNGRQPKIGENVPEFSLEDVRGNTVSSDYFQGKKTLVTFWSMTCPHCVNMMEDLRQWEKTKGANEPNLIVFSQGDAEAHQQFELNAPILLDKEHKTAEKFGMFGTPSAVLVNEEGKIVSETAVGAAQIWALLGKRK